MQFSGETFSCKERSVTLKQQPIRGAVGVKLAIKRAWTMDPFRTPLFLPTPETFALTGEKENHKNSVQDFTPF